MFALHKSIAVRGVIHVQVGAVAGYSFSPFQPDQSKAWVLFGEEIKVCSDFLTFSHLPAGRLGVKVLRVKKNNQQPEDLISIISH